MTHRPPSLDDWNRTAHLIELLGHRGSYATLGHGPPLVLLPSPFALGRTYQAPAAALAASFRVYVVELPGSGSSSRLRKPWSIAEYATWVGAFLTAMELEPVTLIGHSHAGAIALTTAHNFPERLRSLVIVDSIGGGPPAPRAMIAGGLGDLVRESSVVASYGHHLLSNLLTHTSNFLHQFVTCFRLDLLPLAAQVRVPTLVAWGGRDHTLPCACGDRFRRAIPASELYVCATGSHDWILTNQDEFAAAVVAHESPGMIIPGLSPTS